MRRRNKIAYLNQFLDIAGAVAPLKKSGRSRSSPEAVAAGSARSITGWTLLRFDHLKGKANQRLAAGNLQISRQFETNPPAHISQLATVDG